MLLRGDEMSPYNIYFNKEENNITSFTDENYFNEMIREERKIYFRRIS